jgi:uncharacterized BrkB/YihY/UPF0761 family membrane protein
MAGVILVLSLTNFAFSEAYHKDIANDPALIPLSRLDAAVTFFTFLVFLFLLVIIGDYLQRRIRSDFMPKLGDEKAKLAILYIPCLVFLIILMVL